MVDNTKLKNDKKLQMLVVVSLFFSPFTLLRIGRIGISEICFFIFFIILILSWRINTTRSIDFHTFPITFFWIGFIGSAIFGLIYNWLFIKPVSGILTDTIFNFLSYAFVFFCCFLLEFVLSSTEIKDWANEVLVKVFFYLVIAFTILWIISRFTPSLFGLQLRYYLYFVPLAENVHHVSMVIAPMPFIGIWWMTQQKRAISKFAVFLASLWIAFLGIQVGSSKLLLGLATGLGIIIFYKVFRINKIHSQLYVLYILLFLFIATIVFVVMFNLLIDSARGLFISMDVGGGRQTFYSEAVAKIMQSPIFGFGPGSHIYMPGVSLGSPLWWDPHQSFLGAYLEAGIWGFLSLIGIFGYVFYMAHNNPYILAASASIFIYAAGGDILRRLPCWIFLILFVNVNNKDKVSKLQNHQ